MKNKMTEKLFELAYTDSMTEVQNRNAYEERLKKLRKPNANISRITVIVVDVNGLKEINDSYGHFCGDDAIKTVAKALRDTIGLKADIYRIGGDEFCIIIPDCARETAKEKLSIIQKQFAGDLSRPYPKSFSYGLVEAPAKHAPMNAESLIQQADTAMYIQKREHKQQYLTKLS